MRVLFFVSAITLVSIGIPSVIAVQNDIAWGNVITPQFIPDNTIWVSTTTPPTLWNNMETSVDSSTYTTCKSWFDDKKSAACCSDPSANLYGHCHSSSLHNCPGTQEEADCTQASTTTSNGYDGAQCPYYTTIKTGTTSGLQVGTEIYPRCSGVSPHCDGTTGDHCWGLIKCYLVPNPQTTGAVGEIDEEVECENLVSDHGTFTYKTGDFCFGNGNSATTKWCGVVSEEDPDIIDPGNANLQGDPQFAGFQGQDFQFHGLADEVFNLISTPKMQVNGHFVYLSSGKCDYNNTVCFQHPGTYIDQIGVAFQGRQITLVAGTHQKGMFIAINGESISHKGRYTFTATNGEVVTVEIQHHDRVRITSDEFMMTIVNSDMFFNMETSMLNQHLLKLGATKHTITDRTLCAAENNMDSTKLVHHAEHNTTQHNHGQVEAQLQKKYGGVQVPLHGLIGQTWRNALVCGKNWIGAVTDYVASDLFASDYFFNFYKSE